MKLLMMILATVLVGGCMKSTGLKPTEDLAFHTDSTLPGTVNLSMAQALVAQLDAAESSQEARDIATRALDHFTVARQYLPHSTAVLDGQYRMQFALDSMNLQASEQLEQYYLALPEFARLDYTPPEYIDAMQLLLNGADNPAVMQLLQKTIREGRGAERIWVFLANLLTMDKHSNLALFSFNQIKNLDGDPNLQARKAMALDDLAWQGSCGYENKDYLLKAATLYSKAAAASDNAEYYLDAARLYRDSGRYKLARHAANKANSIEETVDSLVFLQELAVASNDYGAAARWLDRLEEGYPGAVDPLYAAMSMMADEHDSRAMKYLENYPGELEGKPFLLGLAVKQWLVAIMSGKKDFAPLVENSGYANDWQLLIGQYLDANEANTDLIDMASNGCEKTEAYFYTAYQYWKKGKRSSARKYLKAVSKQPAVTYIEWELVDLLLPRIR